MKQEICIDGDELTLCVCLHPDEANREKTKENMRFEMRDARLAVAEAGHEIVSIVKKGDVRNFGSGAMSEDTFIFKIRVEEPVVEQKPVAEVKPPAPKAIKKRPPNRAPRKTKEG